MFQTWIGSVYFAFFGPDLPVENDAGLHELRIDADWNHGSIEFHFQRDAPHAARENSVDVRLKTEEGLPSNDAGDDHFVPGL